MPYEKENLLVVSCAYSDIGKVDYLLEQLGVKVIEKTFDAVGGIMQLQASQEHLDAFLAEAKRLVSIVTR
jgi:putative IMPACT (imprinted ancient) family translation regulator